MSDKTGKIVPLISIIFLVSAGIFIYGFMVGHYHKWPFKLLRDSFSAAKSLVKYGEIVPENQTLKAKSYMSRDEWTVYQSDRVQEGYYVIMGYDSETRQYRAWLTDEKGSKLHFWDVSYTRLDSDGPLNHNDAPHPLKVFADGSIIITFDNGDVMARIDQCDNPVWTKTGVFHHSLDFADDGTMWTWLGENSAEAQFQFLHHFDAETGETISEIDLVNDVIKSPETSGYQANLFISRADHKFKHFERNPDESEDYFHPNDIEPLHADMADKFEQFEAGDLLISLRNLNLLYVMDPQTKKIKWSHQGTWFHQHDPDFTNDGKISVFSNNPHTGRSEILKIDPVTNQITNELAEGDVYFYTETQGSHQYLPNGNILITVPGEGRILEVTSTGDMVIENNNVSKRFNGYNEYVANAIWLPKDFYPTLPSCSK